MGPRGRTTDRTVNMTRIKAGPELALETQMKHSEQ